MKNKLLAHFSKNEIEAVNKSHGFQFGTTREMS